MTALVLCLAAILLVAFISLANSEGYVFLGLIGAGLVAALGLPAWAVWGLDDSEEH